MGKDSQPRSQSAGAISESIGCLVILAVIGGMGWLLWLGVESAWAKRPVARPPTHVEGREAFSEIDVLRAQLEQLQSQVTGQGAALRALEFESKVGRAATFSPSSTGYQVVRDGAATFLLTLEKVTPYANGQRLTFRVANPQSITYNDPLFTVAWAPRRPSPSVENFLAAHQAWEASRRTKTETVLKELRPGWWTTFSVVVAPATADDVGDIEVSIAASRVAVPIR